MIHKILYWVSARLPCRLIELDSGPYLERYYLGSLFGTTFYLHRFVSSDSERHLHNHPWGWGRALVLAGGYEEERVVDLTNVCENGCLTQITQVNWWNVINGNTFHRITNARLNTWTLFAHGPRVRVRKGCCSVLKGWGFLEHKYLVGYHDSVYFVPWQGTSSKWWLTAPLGRDAGRVVG